MENVVEDIVLDREWVELIMNAKALGFSVDEIREFLTEARELHK